jgi:adenine-specific DNA-methyltransferase
MNKFIRYIGSKEPLIDFLIENFTKYAGDFKSFGDMFTGTNVVSKYMLPHVSEISSYDISSYSEILNSFVNPKITDDFITYLSELDKQPLLEGIIFNEFSVNGKPTTIDYSRFQSQGKNYRMFFNEDIGKKIDSIREKISIDYKNGHISEEIKNMSLAILLKYTDSNANTTGVYGAYLKKENKKIKNFLSEETINELKEIKYLENKNISFKKMEISDSVNDITYKDIIYFDPPYTTRKYETNYHVLDYISNLNFSIEDIKYNTITALPVNQPINPFGTVKNTSKAFEEMIINSVDKCRYIFISYSTQGLLNQSDIEGICDKYNLNLNVEKKEYKKYKSHNNDVQGNLEELLWIINKA